MSIVFRLAVVEFFRSVLPGKAPGGRDFLWLTLLLAGLQLLAMLILTAREGVLDRSVDVLLGSQPDLGVPVWILPRALGRSQPAGLIDIDLVDEINSIPRIDGEQGSRFPIVPYRRYRVNNMILPTNEASWTGALRTRNAVDGPTFSGVALDQSSALWPELRSGDPNRSALATTNIADSQKHWPIVFNSGLMHSYFDLGAYRDALKGRIPERDFKEIPKYKADLAKMKYIWLRVKVHDTQLAKFRVYWQDYLRIGNRDELFFAPLQLWNMIDQAQRSPSNLCLFVENGPVMEPRLLSLRSTLKPGVIPTQDFLDEKKNEFSQLSNAFEGEVKERYPFVVFEFKNTNTRKAYQKGKKCDPGYPKSRVLAIADDLGLEYDPEKIGEEVTPTAKVDFSTETMTAPCQALSQSALRAADATPDCDEATVPLADRAAGFDEAIIFARSRSELSLLVAYLNCMPVESLKDPSERLALCYDPKFDENGQLIVDLSKLKPESRVALSDEYEDSLVRFGFLSKLIEQLSSPIGWVILTLLVIILLVQLGTLVGHRRMRYAMMLVNGITWHQIRNIVYLQSFMAVASALVLSVGGLLIISILLEPGNLALAEEFESVTLGKVTNPLPLTYMHVVQTGIASALFAVVFASWHLRLAGIAPRVALEKLML